MAFWSKFDRGHWTLTLNGKIIARALRRQNRWIWEFDEDYAGAGAGLAGMSQTLDGAMLAVGRARARATIREA